MADIRAADSSPGSLAGDEPPVEDLGLRITKPGRQNPLDIAGRDAASAPAPKRSSPIRASIAP
jgi:hypothetical protein